jgi:hypothetical protein
MFTLVFLSAMAGVDPPAGLDNVQPWILKWSRDARDIVVVTMGGKIDGAVTVLEPWTGEIKSRTKLNIPELARFSPELERVIFWATSFQGMSGGDRHEVYAAEKESPGHVSCRRMILFLATPTHFVTPDAVIWAENGHLYGLVHTGGLPFYDNWLRRPRYFGVPRTPLNWFSHGLSGTRPSPALDLIDDGRQFVMIFPLGLKESDLRGPQPQLGVRVRTGELTAHA